MNKKTFKKVSLVFAAFCFLAVNSQVYSQDVKKNNERSYQVNYDVRFLGVFIGKAIISSKITDNAFAISGTGKVAGFAALISNGHGSASSKGELKKNIASPYDYKLKNVADDQGNLVEMTMKNNNLIKQTVIPAQTKRPDRIEIQKKHTKNFVDPLTSFLIPYEGKLDEAKACNRTIAIYDGRQRYDIKLSYKSTKKDYSRIKNFNNKVYVCSARYVPIAGHRPERRVTKYMAENKDMEIWLSKLPNDDILIPLRITIGLPAGTIVISAHKFFH